MHLFHFSNNLSIKEFVPRPVQIPAKRPPGREWLNGNLVWAIDDWHQPMYLFPRDCPRILIWPTSRTVKADFRKYFGESKARMLAYIEETWLEKLEREPICRYLMPEENFVPLEDAGMWVSCQTVRPLARQVLIDLPCQLSKQDVELRVLKSLTPLRDVWQSSLHASGIRLCYAENW